MGTVGNGGVVAGKWWGVAAGSGVIGVGCLWVVGGVGAEGEWLPGAGAGVEVLGAGSQAIPAGVAGLG